ncbi:hypothetical protein FV242_21780 [Methylobacterium sp. WL64]|nr:hypothetical protein FV242_21780 [Methylobacterium sp. WL64]
MHAGPSTLADLRKAGIISSQEIVAAIDVYLRDPTAGPYRFSSGHNLDVVAVVADVAKTGKTMFGVGRQDKAYRNAVTAAVMTAQPTPAEY